MKNLNATRKGIITGSLMIILTVLFVYGFKLPVNGNNQVVIILVFAAGIIWSLVSFKKNAAAPVKTRDYFSEGFKTFIVVTFLMVIFTFVFYKLNPQILEEGIKENNALLMKEGNHTVAEIESNSKQMRNVFMPMMLIINTIKYLVLGSLVSVVTAVVLVQKKS